MGSPLVSVIMNCLNGEKYLRESMDSIFAQTYTNWEIVFWDNASTDGTADIAKTYGERVRYFRSEQTYPLGKARNLAMMKARGDFIAFLDSDDIWFPLKLEKQIGLFENVHVGLVFTDAIYFNNRGKRKRLYRNRKVPTGYVFPALLADYYLCLSTVVLSRRAVAQLSECFDERFEMIEEADLFRRIAYSWHCQYVPEPLVMYRVHAESSSWTKMGLDPKETELMIQKYGCLYVDFEQRFSAELRVLRQYVRYNYAKSELLQGSFQDARQRLAPIVFRDARFTLLYLLTFFPRRALNVVFSAKRIMPVG